MSAGDLQRDAQELFGEFFVRRNFRQTEYFYDAKAFGNEVLELPAPSGISIRIVRDRGQIFIDAKTTTGQFTPVDVLLVNLGRGQREYIWPPTGIPPQLVPDMMTDWEKLEKPLLSGVCGGFSVSKA